MKQRTIYKIDGELQRSCLLDILDALLRAVKVKNTYPDIYPNGDIVLLNPPKHRGWYWYKSQKRHNNDRYAK
jgi:hypothetical protein